MTYTFFFKHSYLETTNKCTTVVELLFLSVLQEITKQWLRNCNQILLILEREWFLYQIQHSCKKKIDKILTMRAHLQRVTGFISLRGRQKQSRRQNSFKENHSKRTQHLLKTLKYRDIYFNNTVSISYSTVWIFLLTTNRQIFMTLVHYILLLFLLQRFQMLIPLFQKKKKHRNILLCLQ